MKKRGDLPSETNKINFVPLLTAEQVAGLLNCSKATVYAWAQEGTIPSLKIGGARRFVKDDILKWISRCKDSQEEYNNTAGRRTTRKGGLTSGPL